MGTGAAPKPPSEAKARTSQVEEAKSSRRLDTVRALGRRSGAEVARLLHALGLRAPPSSEAQDLARLIAHKLAHAASADEEQAVDQLEVQRAFLTHRFVGPMQAYEAGDRRYAYMDTVLNLASIACGVGASLAAALEAPKVWAIILGLAVGLMQSLSQWLKPSQRSARRGMAASTLRNEAWSLLQGRDRYRAKDDRSAWSAFCNQVMLVEEREEKDEDDESAPPDITGTSTEL